METRCASCLSPKWGWIQWKDFNPEVQNQLGRTRRFLQHLIFQKIKEILAKIGGQLSFSLPLENVAAEWEDGKLGINKHMEWLFWDSISDDKMSFFWVNGRSCKDLRIPVGEWTDRYLNWDKLELKKVQITKINQSSTAPEAVQSCTEPFFLRLQFWAVSGRNIVFPSPF